MNFKDLDDIYNLSIPEVNSIPSDFELSLIIMAQSEQNLLNSLFPVNMMDSLGQELSKVYENSSLLFREPTINHSVLNSVEILCKNMSMIPETYFDFYNNVGLAMVDIFDKNILQIEKINTALINTAETIMNISRSVNCSIDRIYNVLTGISSSIANSITAINSAWLNVDYSPLFIFYDNLSAIDDFEEKNEVLKNFKWFYSSEIPNEIIDEIYIRRSEITQDEVDSMITEYFNKNKQIKRIVKNWVDLPYFENRRHVFKDARIAHSRQLYNASTTLMAIHFEGIVIGFTCEKMKKPEFQVKNALKCINDLTDELPAFVIPFTDFIVFSYVLNAISKTYSEYFSPVNPDNCSNTSRHKIAHGQATEKETEANSLRLFLFMNELYKLLYCLENEYQQIA